MFLSLRPYIEALVSGLPTLYQRGSGHDELVKDAGLPFVEAEEIPALLDKMVENYERYQEAIRVTKVKDAADQYLEVYAKCLGLIQ